MPGTREDQSTTRTREDQSTTPPGREDPLVGDAVVRLSAEFHGVVGRSTVLRTVDDSRRDLAGAPVNALPELVERLARERIAQAVHARSVEPQRAAGA
jgi:hypothetical protein